MEVIRLRVTPTPTDYARVNSRLIRETYKEPGCIFGIIVFAIGALVFIPVMSARPGTLPGFGLALLVFVVLILLSPWMSAQRYRKVIQAAGETTFEFADENVLVKDNTGELKQPWSGYKKVIVMKDYYLLVFALNGAAGRFVPRRAFESPEQEAAFRDLLAHKLNFKP